MESNPRGVWLRESVRFLKTRDMVFLGEPATESPSSWGILHSAESQRKQTLKGQDWPLSVLQKLGHSTHPSSDGSGAPA